MNRQESLAEEHLLRLIRDRDPDGWAQFVQRYQGRMIAYAKAQTGQLSDAEDLVQETFIGFLRSLESYRGESKLETCLFRILRRRIIDYYRSRGTCQEIPACALGQSDSQAVASDLLAAIPDQQFSPSVFIQRQEQRDDDDRALSAALHTVLDRMKQESNLRDLMITEGLFYAGIKNRKLSQMMELDEGKIAVVRHRLLQRLRVLVDQTVGNAMDDQSSLSTPDLLSRIWERDRPSCPKRTTLGKSLMGILDAPWQQYVTFHVDMIGCKYCTANREDLQRVEQEHAASARCQRLFQSTIGFISRPE